MKIKHDLTIEILKTVKRMLNFINYCRKVSHLQQNFSNRSLRSRTILNNIFVTLKSLPLSIATMVVSVLEVKHPAYPFI